MGESGERTSLSRRRKRPRSRASQTIGKIWSEWRVEILCALVVMLAVFLLFERVAIRQTLASGFRQGLQLLDRLAERSLQALTNFVRHTTLSDLIAYFLLLFACLFAVFRLRWRLMRLPRLQARECPRCGGELRRIHRRRTDRLLSLYVPVQRYQCANHDCRWQGLRVREQVR
jgi:hypothetical protein